MNDRQYTDQQHDNKTCQGCGVKVSTYVAQYVYTCYCGFVNAPARKEQTNEQN